MFKKVQSLPMSFFNGYKTGEINAAVMGYPHQIKTAVVEISNDLVVQPLTLVSAISFLIYKSFQSESFFMAVIGVSSAPIIVLLIRRIGVYLAKKAKELVVLGEALGSSVIESFQSPIEIRAYNMESKQIKDFVSKMKQIFILHMKSVRFGLLMSPSIEFISGVGIAIALYLGVKNGMGEGDFLALVVALYMAYTPLKKIGGILNCLKTMEPPLDRLEEVLHTDVKISCPQEPKQIASPFTGEIKFDNVSFRYHEDQPTLKNISLLIPYGESIGLVGESGAGKSTFVNLLIRLYDPCKGRVLLDSIDIRELDLKELRNLVSYVPQTPILFNDTVLENIRIGKPEADEADIIQAAKYARAHEFISELENGYQTVISERGASLSGGQRQRISIARAFLKNSPILILDEAHIIFRQQS
jgi:subfamily B ATP-binding cassette protein MsbA